MVNLDFLKAAIANSPTFIMTEGHNEKDINLIAGTLNMDEDILWELSDEDIEALVRRANRVKYCNTQWVYVFQATAALKAIARRCGDWRTCQYCRNGRIIDLRGRTLRGLVEKRDERKEGNTLRMISGTIAKIFPIRSSLPKENYLSLPQADNHCILLVDTPVDCEGIDLNYDAIEALPWQSMVLTPVGRRISGNLGAVEKEEDGKVSIKSFGITARDSNHINASSEHVEQACREAIESVIKGELNLKSVTAIEDHLLMLALRFRKALKRIGKEAGTPYTVKIRDWYIRADLACISPWNGIQAILQSEIPIGTPDIPF